MNMRKAILRLKDGTEFSCRAYGHQLENNIGEVVFNTGIPGYQEILTDPSYNGQIVVMTSPMIGNYGITAEDNQSSGAKATALIVRKLYRGPVAAGRMKLEEYLEREGIPVVDDIDTRGLTLYIREHGSQNGVLFYPEDREEAEKKLSAFPSISERDLIEGVAVKEKTYNPRLGKGFAEPPAKPEKHYAVVDFGIKTSIIDNLYRKNIAVTLLPPSSTAEDVLSLSPSALFLSNGPGDPALLEGAVEMARGCIGKIPVEGICLGHQIITIALGGRTKKMKFGHHGSNQPVFDTRMGKTFVTAQNHGFMSDPDSLPEGTEVWFRNANDGSIEGIRNDRLSVLSVQFHPEAAPGPEDGLFIFDEFKRMAR